MAENEDGALDGGGIFAEAEEGAGELKMTAEVFFFGAWRVSWVRDGVSGLGKHALEREGGGRERGGGGERGGVRG